MLTDIALVVGVSSGSAVALTVVFLFAVGKIKRFQGSGFGVHADIEAVVREVKPNGGSSMRDAIDRIDRRTADLDARLTAIEEAVTAPGRKP